MKHFSPHLEILPRPQRRLWDELPEVSGEFVLYGGTALALHLGHRNSVDFDLFGSRDLDLAQIEQGISFLKGANVIQRDRNTLTAIVDRGGPVKVSFFGVPNLPRLSAAVVAAENGLGVASLLDLAGTKASVVQMRAEAKDYVDIDALMTTGKVELPLATAVRLDFQSSNHSQGPLFLRRWRFVITSRGDEVTPRHGVARSRPGSPAQH
jgi:hypothetical protein